MLKYVEGKDLIGKTVSGVETLNDETVVLFSDGSYTRVGSDAFYAITLRDAARYYRHEPLIAMGLFTAEELAAEKAVYDAEIEASRLKYELAQYEKLRTQFEPQAIEDAVNAKIRELSSALAAMKLPSV
jgi:hypothetical protein